MSKEQQRRILLEKIHRVNSGNFEALALEIFQFQAIHNNLYREYISLLNIDYQLVTKIKKIPFLPIQFFKKHSVKTGNWKESAIFTSSGTTGSTPSRHFIRDLFFYKKNASRGFEFFFGKPSDYCILALLPSYLERTGSSLIYMMDYFIRQSGCPESGFFLNNTLELVEVLKRNRNKRIPTLLFGVSFALLDLAEAFPMDLSKIILMETGGMKGRRTEMTRDELHQILKEAFQVDLIFSEYGMTELLSQAYSKGNGIFSPSPTMRILAKEITDPFSIAKKRQTGVVNVVDLANLDTCCFVATEDLGKVFEDGSFEIVGRLDASDWRGCNLLIAEG